MLLQAVNLHPVAVVYVDVFLLGNGKHLVIVQPLGIPHGLAELQFAPKLPIPPVHCRDMALPPRQQEIPSVSCVVADIRAQVVQLQLKALLGRLNRHVVLDVALADLVRPLQLRLRLDEAPLVLEQDLRVFRLQRRILVLVLQHLQVPAKLLVLDPLHGNVAAAPIVALCFLAPPQLRLLILCDGGSSGCAHGSGAARVDLGKGIVDCVRHCRHRGGL